MNAVNAPPHHGLARYDIVQVLAAAGATDVLLAHQRDTGGGSTPCVMKRLKPGHATDLELGKRLLDRARRYAPLRHPNLTAIHDVGISGGRFYVTQELVRGLSLRAWVARLRERSVAMPIGCAIQLITQAARGLDHAHHHDVVHGALSPSALMVSLDGEVKLLGLHGTAHDASPERTRYLAPERRDRALPDPRGDLFALGVVLWELLTCGPMPELAGHGKAGERGGVIAPSSRRPAIPASLDAVVLRLLSPEPTDRYDTAHAALRALAMVPVERKPGELIALIASTMPTHELPGGVDPREEATRSLRVPAPSATRRAGPLDVTDGEPTRARPVPVAGHHRPSDPAVILVARPQVEPRPPAAPVEPSDREAPAPAPTRRGCRLTLSPARGGGLLTAAFNDKFVDRRRQRALHMPRLHWTRTDLTQGG